MVRVTSCEDTTAWQCRPGLGPSQRPDETQQRVRGRLSRCCTSHPGTDTRHGLVHGGPNGLGQEGSGTAQRVLTVGSHDVSSCWQEVRSSHAETAAARRTSPRTTAFIFSLPQHKSNVSTNPDV